MDALRVPVTLSRAEYEALAKLAERDVRRIDHQARYMIRLELEQHGLLETTAQKGAKHDR